MEFFSSKSHLAGTLGDYETVIEVKKRLESYGLDTLVEEFPVLLSYPLTRLVELIEPKNFICSLKEDIVNDGTSGNSDIPTFNGYSATGEVIGKLVYANYGREEDFKLLEDMNVDVNGTIVIVRYGMIFRGNKVLSAQNRGAIGVLIYTDPKDTGFSKGTVYPEGPWSNNSTVQRGSIWMGNGDPTTPGYPSVINGPRLDLSELRNKSKLDDPLPTIPVQPLSYGDAFPLLSSIEGANIPDQSWQGGLNFIYKVGPGPAKVRIKIINNETINTIWNVIGKIPGETEPDRLVIMGSHRDAWSLGAGDPISGHSVLLEAARVFGNLKKQGWRPRRTILLCSWDAEEYGLIGSVEFVEKHFQSLFSRTVVYLNLDIAVDGTDYFDVEGSPSFFGIMNELTQKISFQNGKIKDKWNRNVGLLGTGSDFVPFFHYAGISSNTIQFKSENEFFESVYHSNYDSFYWYKNFADPKFEAHASVTKIYGLLGMRFADSRVIPLDLRSYSNALNEYISEIQKLQFSQQVFWKPINDSIERFSRSIDLMEENIQKAKIRDISVTDEILRFINDRLMMVERCFITNDELLTGKNKFYRHVIFKPSDIDSYAGTAFSNIYDSIFVGDLKQANYLVKRISLIIDDAAEFLQNDLFI